MVEQMSHNTMTALASSVSDVVSQGLAVELTKQRDEFQQRFTQIENHLNSQRPQQQNTQQKETKLRTRSKSKDRKKKKSMEDTDDSCSSDSDTSCTPSDAWGDLLPDTTLTATSPGALSLLSRLRAPPYKHQLGPMLKEQADSKRFEGAPRDPRANRGKTDKAVGSRQFKIECCMNLLLMECEKSGNLSEEIAQTALILRALWEDDHQTRRRLGAGKSANKLDPRVDGNPCSLYSKKEQKLIQENRGKDNKKQQPFKRADNPHQPNREPRKPWVGASTYEESNYKGPKDKFKPNWNGRPRSASAGKKQE